MSVHMSVHMSIQIGGRLLGVLHLAGESRSMMLASASAEDWISSQRAKIDGLANLLESVREIERRDCTTYASAAVRFFCASAIHVHAHVHMHTCSYTCPCTCTYTCPYICPCTCPCVCAHAQVRFFCISSVLSILPSFGSGAYAASNLLVEMIGAAELSLNGRDFRSLLLSAVAGAVSLQQRLKVLTGVCTVVS